MRKLTLVAVLLMSSSLAFTQNDTAENGVKKACLNYIEGFYEGDEAKLKMSLQPSLNKFGFWKNKDTGNYQQVKHMSYDRALAYARNVLEKKQFAKPGDPKKVEILDIGNTIASAKVTANWGIDYMLLSKHGDRWMIEQVLWEGPLDK